MWHQKNFSQLTSKELFIIFRARQAVFVVEQNCAYADIDDYDLTALHVFSSQEGQLCSYGRIIEPVGKPRTRKLERVLVTKQWRGQNHGRELLGQLLESCHQQRAQAIILQAQTYLLNFYSSFGFQTTSSPYLVDGIEHIDMRLITDFA